MLGISNRPERLGIYLWLYLQSLLQLQVITIRTFGPSTVMAVDINGQNFADRRRTSLAYDPLNRILTASYTAAPQKILLVVIVR